MTSTDCHFYNKKLITILGGSGYVGKYIAAKLVKQGYRVRIVSRNPEKVSEILLLGNVGQVQIIKANVRYPQTIMSVLKDADAVINLISITQERGKQTFKAIHAEGAKLVAEMCAHLKVPLIHFSALGANELAKGAFYRYKAAGEKNVKKYYPEAIILRPAIIFGREDNNFFKLAETLRYSPIIPIFNGGKSKLQPVYVGDVAQMVAEILDKPDLSKKMFELVGPQTLTVKEICDITLDAIKRKRKFIPISFQIAYLLSRFFEIFSKITGKKPTITSDFILSLQSDNILSATAKNNCRTLEAYNITQTSFELFAQDNFKRFCPKGNYENYNS